MQQLTKQNELTFQLIIESVPNAIILVNMDGRIAFVNKQAEVQFGFSRSELIGLSIEVVIPERFRKSHMDLRNMFFGSPHARPMGAGLELLALRKDGTEFPVEIGLNPLVTLDGTMVLAAIIDITERKRAEERFRLVFESAPHAMLVLDQDTGTFVKYNNNALNLLGLTGEELLNKGPADISPAIQPDGSWSEEKIKGIIMKAKDGEEPVFEWAIHDAKGRQIMLEMRLTFLTGFKGPQILSSFVDITDRKNAESLRQKMTADILPRNKELEQFAYVVSHNLRAPVANIIGILNLMSLNKPETEIEIKTALLTSVKILDNVIKDLSNILQIKNAIDEKKQRVRFSEVLEDIKISISGSIINDKVAILSDFSAIDEITAIKSYLYSIFLNIVSNSIKYRQPGLSPVIEIRSALSTNKIELFFKDNGLGINLEKGADQVFELYKRFHTHVEGKGMGLFMVKSQVETMGGQIHVASEVNKGTEFRIEFNDDQ